MNIIQKIKELNLLKDQYVVVGSGIMNVLGIRESNDIDIAVTKELHKKLRESGEWEENERYNRIFLNKDIYEIIPQLNWENYDTTTEEAISSATIIDDIPFMNLDELIKFKTAMGREKDFKDIELIKEYMKNNHKSFNLAKEYLNKEVKVTIDRPLGSKHPKHDFIYEVNYGYIEGVIAPDGEELDAYVVGINEPISEYSGVCIAVAHRRDNDDDKLIVVPKDVNITDEEILKLINFQEKWFDTEIVR